MLFGLESHQSIVVWAYGFLLLSSAVSIPVETGAVGKAVRQEMSEQGIFIDRYDLISNVLRSIVYLAVIFALIKPVNGALLAYGIALSLIHIFYQSADSHRSAVGLHGADLVLCIFLGRDDQFICLDGHLLERVLPVGRPFGL